ncbi:MAG: AtpZ/AtpI family protein [Hyphomicrobiaceae bacterium]|nr:AtpZ/AtpI family protein [Hyphomicrobiaceae bacterium]
MSSAGKGDPPQRGELSPEDRAAFRERASDLGRRLEAARGTDATGTPASRAPAGSGSNGGMGSALRMSTELIGGVVVGAGIGWLLDQDYVLGTWPAMFIVFFLLGSAAGMLNVVRAGMKMKTGPSDPAKGPAVRDDDDDT